jgi:hypothetical protein
MNWISFKTQLPRIGQVIDIVYGSRMDELIFHVEFLGEEFGWVEYKRKEFKKPSFRVTQLCHWRPSK